MAGDRGEVGRTVPAAPGAARALAASSARCQGRRCQPGEISAEAFRGMSLGSMGPMGEVPPGFVASGPGGSGSVSWRCLAGGASTLDDPDLCSGRPVGGDRRPSGGGRKRGQLLAGQHLLSGQQLGVGKLVALAGEGWWWDRGPGPGQQRSCQGFGIVSQLRSAQLHGAVGPVLGSGVVPTLRGGATAP